MPAAATIIHTERESVVEESKLRLYELVATQGSEAMPLRAETLNDVASRYRRLKRSRPVKRQSTLSTMCQKNHRRETVVGERNTNRQRKPKSRAPHAYLAGSRETFCELS